MSNSLKINIATAPTEIDDAGVINQLPAGVRKSLGNPDDSSGMHLLTGVRDVGFDKGFIKYKVGETSVEVVMD